MNKEGDLEKARAQIIDRQKRLARSLYIAYRDLVPDVNCGVALTEYIYPDLTRIRNEFNAVMEHLRTIDPTAPDFKL